MKLAEKKLGKHQITGDIGCHLFAALPPFEIGGSTMGYGLGPASNAAFDGGGERRAVSFLGDGGFWHNGIPSSRADNTSKATGNPIPKALEGVGVKWVRKIDRTYDVSKMRATIEEALTTDYDGPKVIVASSECMLNKQRREKPLKMQSIADGKRVETPRFGVDEDICTGDHACIRLSGCPSLSLKLLDDPLRDDPVAHIDQTCVGCGNCGEVADAAVLCPSFYSADVVHNPGEWETKWARWSEKIISWLQNRRDVKSLRLEELR